MVDIKMYHAVKSSIFHTDTSIMRTVFILDDAQYDLYKSQKDIGLWVNSMAYVQRYTSLSGKDTTFMELTTDGDYLIGYVEDWIAFKTAIDTAIGTVMKDE